MSDWALVATITIICTYKLIDRWLDQREQDEPPGEHRTAYSDAEIAYRDPGSDDGGYHYRPEPQIGFKSNDQQ